MDSKFVKFTTDYGVAYLSRPMILCLNDLVIAKLEHARFELEHYSGSNECSKDWLSNRAKFYFDLLNGLRLLFPSTYETDNRDNG